MVDACASLLKATPGKQEVRRRQGGRGGVVVAVLYKCRKERERERTSPLCYTIACLAVKVVGILARVLFCGPSAARVADAGIKCFCILAVRQSFSRVGAGTDLGGVGMFQHDGEIGHGDDQCAGVERDHDGVAWRGPRR